jgi:hypothetical protein
LWPGYIYGQAQSQEQPTQEANSCVSKEVAQEVLRLGRSLGYKDDEILAAYAESACAALSRLRREMQEKTQPNPVNSLGLKDVYAKCLSGASEVSIWVAPGDLTVVASAACGERLDVLEDGELWVRVRTDKEKRGYIPRAAVSDSPGVLASPDPGPKPAFAVTNASPGPPGAVTSVGNAPSCNVVVSFALADASGVHPFMGTGNWIQNWIRKNGKKHPDVCFSQNPLQGRRNYLIALSQSAHYLSGFDPVVRTNTSTSTSPVSGSGTVTDNYGGMWNYTYSGTVTTTTTTTTTEDVPYTINSNTLFANAYDERGTLVSQRSHLYSTKSGGDAANSFGYNMGNALRAINARGRILESVIKDIEGRK